jgi:dihydroorotase-like cyclic amidohydrolase
MTSKLRIYSMKFRNLKQFKKFTTFTAGLSPVENMFSLAMLDPHGVTKQLMTLMKSVRRISTVSSTLQYK